MNPDPCEECLIAPATVGELVCSDCLAHILDEMELMYDYQYAAYTCEGERRGAGTYLEVKDDA